ncbi:MAG: OPT/YSL family transporter [Rhizobiales bacterium]|nr:OPT/YSL family transporter [Hyphomicrobiales bacterium]
MVTQNATAGAISLGAAGADTGHAKAGDDAGNRRDTAAEPRHPRTLEPATFLLILVMSVFGGVIGMQILTTLGITPNTSIVGALAAMALARIPLQIFRRYRSTHVQNLVQSAISSATFGAANSLLLPIGIPYALGRPDLIAPIFIGVAAAMVLDGYLLYRLYGSAMFPAEGAWPPGVAAAEAIRAGDEGGRNALVLGLGVGFGAAGSWFGIPMSAFGSAFIGNIWALSMFGLGLLLRGYSGLLFSGPVFAGLVPRGDLAAAFVPHGMMVGAGLMALLQMLPHIWRKPSDKGIGGGVIDVRTTLGFGSLAYIGIAAFIAAAGGLVTEMSPGMLVAFVFYAALAALVHELIVGLAAMHTGWFPAFAVALITLMIGIMIGFPITALALLAGFTAATGPAFADMGYDLKAGTILRGGHSARFELDGRREQLYASLIAFAVAIAVVGLSWRSFFAQDLIPPIDRVYAAAINAGVSSSTATSLLLWAIPGALLQFLGGAKRQLGVLLATGLLLSSPLAGWAVLVGIVARLVWLRRRSPTGQTTMEVFAGGVIAGDALFSFTTSVAANMTRPR